MLVHYLALLCHLALIGPETTAPRTRSTAGEIRISTPARVPCWGPRFCRDLSAEPRRSLDLCRPAAISGALEAISRLTLATRLSLSFACAVVSGPYPCDRSDRVELRARCKIDDDQRR